MTTLETTGTLLASNEASRELRYRLLKFNEIGSTSVGLLAADPGSVTIPEDVSTLVVNEEHDPRRPVGRFTSIEETPEYIDATITIAKTRAGDDALELAASGLRKGISVELSNIVTRSGRLRSGLLSGAGLTVAPAYPSSVLTASDHGEVTEEEPQTPEDDQSEADPATDTDTDTDSEEITDMGQTPATPPAAEPALTASAFTDLLKSLGVNTDGAQSLQASAPTTSLADLASAVSGVHANPGDRTLLASALDTIAQPNVYDVVAQPAYIGELWRGRAYRQRFAPLLNRRPLTSATRVGWKFREGMTPQVDVWDPAFTPTSGSTVDPAAPNLGSYEMTDIPSNPVAAEPVTFGVGRIAGGWRSDRVHKDLPTPGYWEAFWREATEDYARKEDGLAMAAVTATAPSYTATGSDAANAWSKLILGAAIVSDFTTPEWAVVGNDIWRELANTTEQERLAFLNAQLGLDNTDGKLTSFAIVAAPYSRTDLNGTVTVGARNAIDLYTLGGGDSAPIRVSAEVVEKGATDEALFGYYSLDTISTKGLAKVVTAP